jgi:hypothetical protein
MGFQCKTNKKKIDKNTLKVRERKKELPHNGALDRDPIVWLRAVASFNANQNKRVTRACEHKYLSLLFNSLTNPHASQSPASNPHSSYSMDCPLPVDNAVPCTVRTSWAWDPSTVAGMQQLVHVHVQCSNLMLCVVLNPWHAHQHRIAQSGIAPSPNNRSLMHGGAQSNHPERASVRVSKEHESNQSINQSINQIHPLHLAHLHPQQLHILRADIAPRPNVHRLPSRLACHQPANTHIPHI